jgi:cytochrome P450
MTARQSLQRPEKPEKALVALDLKRISREVSSMTGSSRLPPGPATNPVRQLLRYSFRPLEFLEQGASNFGDTFTLRLAGLGTFVQLTRPKDIRDVFKADSTVLHAGEVNALLSSVVGDTSVLVLDGKSHVRQRKAMLPPLKGERMRTFFDVMQAEALAVAERWTGAGFVRADKAMQGITLRVIIRASLGLESGAEFDSMQRDMAKLLMHVRHPLALVMWKLFPLERYENSKILPFYRMRRKFDDGLHQVFDRLRALNPADRPECLLKDLLATTYDDGSVMSYRELRDAIVTVLAAGHDTTALGLAWAFELILSRPEVVERIEAELEELTGGALPRIDQIQKLPYLDAVIRESLRVRTVIPMIARVVKQDFSVGAFSYARDVILCPSIHLLHMREDLYPEPTQFRPERFLQRKFAPYEWIPFGGGNRACLGQAFALYEMKVVLATIFSTLRLERPVGAASRPVRRGVSIGPSDGALVRVTERRQIKS